jgi:hypothetical protein
MPLNQDFFKGYKDSYFAHIFEVVEMAFLILVIMWVQTGVTSGTSEYDIVDFTWKLGMVGLVLKLADFLVFILRPKKADAFVLQTLGMGSIWRFFWGLILGGALVGIVNTSTNLSFFSTFLQFDTVYMFWFLVFIGPRLEEIFSNTLHPILTNLVIFTGRLYGRSLSYLVGGSIALIIVAALFALFHYFTYYTKAQADIGLLSILLLAAFMYRIIFTVGNYVLKTDEFGKWAHSTHNLIGYIIAVGNPLKILPVAQQLLIFGTLIFIGASFTFTALTRIGTKGLYNGLKPDTVLDD